MHKFCIKKLPTGERVHKKDHFHDQRCASCLDNEDDDHILQCTKQRSIRKKVLNQINLLRNTVDPKLCGIMREGLMTYFKGESVSTAMLRLRGQEDVDKNQTFKRYTLLIDEQVVIGWDNLLRGKFSKQWKIQQKAFITRRKLPDPRAYARARKNKKRKEAKNNKGTKKKNKTEAFHAFFQAIIPIIQETWTDRCIDRNTPVLGGRIVAEYDSLTKKITHLYTLKEMVLPEDESKIFNEPLKTRLADTNQQLKKWINRWREVIDHSMKRVKELAQDNSKPIWRHFTANKPAKTTVSRKTNKGKKATLKKMHNNPLTNVFKRMKKKRSSSRVLQAKKTKYKMNHMISKLYTQLGKKRSTSRTKIVMDVEIQEIDDRFGDVPK